MTNWAGHSRADHPTFNRRCGHRGVWRCAAGFGQVARVGREILNTRSSTPRRLRSRSKTDVRCFVDPAKQECGNDGPAAGPKLAHSSRFCVFIRPIGVIRGRHPHGFGRCRRGLAIYLSTADYADVADRRINAKCSKRQWSFAPCRFDRVSDPNRINNERLNLTKALMRRRWARAAGCVLHLPESRLLIRSSA
jgi:hypothetical protein